MQLVGADRELGDIASNQLCTWIDAGDDHFTSWTAQVQQRLSAEMLDEIDWHVDGITFGDVFRELDDLDVLGPDSNEYVLSCALADALGT